MATVPRNIAFIVSCLAVAWTVLLPFFPAQILDIFRGTVGSLLLLVLVISAVSLGPTAGSLVFLAALLTFVQRNRGILQTKMSSRTDQKVREPSYDAQMESAPPLSQNEVHPPALQPETEDLSFLPSDADGTNHFEPVDSTINEKTALQTISSLPERATDYYLQQGLADTTLKG
jgi:hypothetical protein